ncbi:hypothetical protein G6F50_014788 [Rhizopus delemar]|uniref:ABC transporter domain-containing protein n=1 Tax=Rhizopus delemar TaxID=936053 RepID=A0A9P6Y3F4_9FUNG|nr:hypothetical protein G6F50_014788 [Rhizopus delemar]
MGIARTFQNIRLFKEMTLLENVVVGAYRHMNYGFPSLLLGLPGYREHEKRARERAHELLTWMRLDHKANDLADNLSYGEQRRVALARALVIRPSVLLLDEPLSNLDAKLREEMQLELRSIQRTIGTTTILVTHDQSEALALSDRIVGMNQGRVEQVADPFQAYEGPASHFVGGFLGKANVFTPLSEQER